MYKEHTVFNPPVNPTQKIWRYMDFIKFVDLLSSKSLYFTRSDLFDDPFEGSIPKTVISERKKSLGIHNEEFWAKRHQEARLSVSINCWHMNDFESYAMWKVFLKSNEGIAIQSNYTKLKNCFTKSTHDIFIGAVDYIDYETDYLPDPRGGTPLVPNLFSPYLHKRKNYNYENELRCIIWAGSEVGEFKKFESGGIKIEIELTDLIEHIFISPESPIWFTNLVQDVCKKFHLDVPIKNSILSERPIF